MHVRSAQTVGGSRRLRARVATGVALSIPALLLTYQSSMSAVALCLVVIAALSIPLGERWSMSRGSRTLLSIGVMAGVLVLCAPLIPDLRQGGFGIIKKNFPNTLLGPLLKHF